MRRIWFIVRALGRIFCRKEIRDEARTTNRTQMTSLLLHVWREVGRHLEIHESVERVVPALAERLPLEHVIVRRIDVQRSCLETVAWGAAEGAPPVDTTKTAMR